MKTLFFVSAFVISFSINAQNHPSKDLSASFEQLEWILGKWQRTNAKEGSMAFENWKKESEHLFTGMGISMRGADTTFIENLRIEIKDSKIYYVADVRENATPTYFEITDITKSGFVSKNPDHDFPKVISYELKEGIMTAIISDGAEKKMGFVFQKAIINN